MTLRGNVTITAAVEQVLTDQYAKLN